VPHEVDVLAYASLDAIFDQSCDRFRELPCLTNMGVTLTYGEVDRHAHDFAAYLQSALKLAPGDRLAIVMPNLLQYPVALFGAFRAGLVVVNCNPLYTPRELEHQLADSGAKAVVVLENFARTVAEVIGKTAVESVIVATVGDLFPGLEGWLTNFVVKHVKHMVPAWPLCEG